MALVTIPYRYTTRPGIQIQKAWLHWVVYICTHFAVACDSGYRTAADNKRVGGASNSDHLRGDAADFVGTTDAMARLRAWAQPPRFPYVEPPTPEQPHVHISFRHQGKGAPSGEPPPRAGKKRIHVLRGYAAVTAVRALCGRYQLDVAAVCAVASVEGGQGKIGDHGNSYGPWQMNRVGRLPKRWARLGRNSAKTQAWAWSRPAFDYALASMARLGAKGQVGHQAVSTIVSRFEQPLDIPGEIVNANRQYDFLLRAGHDTERDLASIFVGPKEGGSYFQQPPPEPHHAPPGLIHLPGSTTDAERAWHHLMHTFGVHIPRQAARVRMIAHQLRHALR